jgi:hypothetical protein
MKYDDEFFGHHMHVYQQIQYMKYTKQQLINWLVMTKRL